MLSKKLLFAALASVQCADTCTNCVTVDHCDVNGVVEMAAKIKKSEVMTKPDGFADTAGDWYTAKFNKDQLDVSFTTSPRALVLKKTINKKTAVIVKDRDGKDVSVYMKTGNKLNFTCTYPLDDQVVSDTVTVTGKDLHHAADNTGTLGYTLELDDRCDENDENCDLHRIGSTASFTITPKNPDLVYASVKNCKVHRGGKHVVVIGEGGDMCLNDFLSSTLSVWTGQKELKGSFTAFKWSTTVGDADPESQSLQCTLGLSETASTTVPRKNC